MPVQLKYVQNTQAMRKRELESALDSHANGAIVDVATTKRRGTQLRKGNGKAVALGKRRRPTSSSSNEAAERREHIAFVMSTTCDDDHMNGQ